MVQRIVDLPSPSIGVENMDDRASAFVIGESAGQPVYDPAFTGARQGMVALVDATGKLMEAEQASKAGGLDQTAALRLQRGATKTLAGATKALETALTTLGDHRTRLDAEIEQALGVQTVRVSVTDNARGAEVRSYVRSLGDLERIAAIQDALTNGDREFIAGILAMPRLAGISPKEAAQLAADAAQTFAPAAFARRSEIDVLARRLRTAGDAFADRFGALAGQGDSPAAKVERALAGLEGGQN